MAVVLPQGALFRKGVEGNIRQKLLELDLIEAVIGLAPNLFYGTGLAACILVLRKRKPESRKKKVLIADASRLFRRGRAQNFLEPEHATEILGIDVHHDAALLAVVVAVPCGVSSRNGKNCTLSLWHQ
ncbi:N-6 DNA methylase [Aeromonas caviae]|jgi:type I restriction enzyme M protein|uniref:N-6 DNA methylase n=1 Tax=Aeromonas caviae TaxID=648 RepID=UPI00069BFA21|nr:N-6 DNA methylase [Aeromonas caviae]QXW31604.1 SAM-dependent methyltransferase [Aeromonas sanarellii]